MAITSSLALAVLALLPEAQGFGRFGYVEQGEVPGFIVQKDGFAATLPTADKLRFVEPSKRWKPLLTSEFSQTVGLSEGSWKPAKARFDLLSLGFSLYCPSGLSLSLSSTSAPYLSWVGGSVAENVPTPAVRWALLSFRDSQPPLVFGFIGGRSSLVVSGRPGQWTLRTGNYSGWIRVALPVGLRPVPANSAAALGRLVNEAAANESQWIASPVEAVSRVVEEDDFSVTSRWTFSRPGAVIPPSALLASLGGYSASLQTDFRQLPFDFDRGPVLISETAEMAIRFPVRKIPAGRAVGLEPPEVPPIGTCSPLDVPSVADLAMENLIGTRDPETKKTADGTLAEFLTQATYVREPFSGQLLPYGADGSGLDVAAANALLMEAVGLGAKPEPDANSLLTSVAWRRDWHSWLLISADAARARRATALACIAAALRHEPVWRAEAGILQAGMAGSRGLQVWRRRKGRIAEETKMIEPMLEMRSALFGLTKPVAPARELLDFLKSPIRVFGEPALRMRQTLQGPMLTWGVVEAKPSVFAMKAPVPLLFAPYSNLSSFVSAEEFGLVQIRYRPEAAGNCEVSLALADTDLPPRAIKVPLYSEPAL